MTTDPSGSVTMYYNYVEPQIIEILESEAKNSKNLFEFVERLGSFVCSKSKEVVPAHIAAVLAFELRDSETTNAIAAKFDMEPIVRPWTFSMRTRSDRLSIQDKVEVSIERALQTDPEPWIVMELLLLKAYTLVLKPEGSGALDEAKKLLNESQDLQFFEPNLRHVEARVLWQEGSMEEAIKICEKGIECAREFENHYELSRLLAWKGIITTSFNAMKALELLEEAYKLAEMLGDRFHMNGYLLEMAEVSTTMGEYDLALEYFKTASETYAPKEGPMDQIALAISLLHSDLGDYDEALTWAEWNYEKHLDAGTEGDVFALCALAWPLILMGRLDRAEQLIDQARTRVLTSGHEPELGMCHFVSGLHELATGNVDTALMTLEEAYSSFKNLKNSIFIVRSLQALAKAEMLALKEPDVYGKVEGICRWVNELEKFAQENRLPGILMYSYLLKSDYCSMQGKKKEAMRTLEEGLKIYDSPGVKTLRKTMLSRMTELTKSK